MKNWFKQIGVSADIIKISETEQLVTEDFKAIQKTE
jgi:hypothetical protein